MLKKVLIAVGAAAIASVGGSLLYPFGTAGVPGTNQTILREAQIDPGTLRHRPAGVPELPLATNRVALV